MTSLKISAIPLILILAAVAMAGCTTSSSDNKNSTPMVVAVVGAPTATPAPTMQYPTFTPIPTAAPTPTPVPQAVTAYDVNITMTKIEGTNPLYASRQDTVTFIVKDTGDAELDGLSIAYQVGTPMNRTYNGQPVVSTYSQYTNTTIGTMKPGDEKTITLLSPLYAEYSEADVTITAVWNDGSLVLFNTKIQPSAIAGSPPSGADTSGTPAGAGSVISYGAAS